MPPSVCHNMVPRAAWRALALGVSLLLMCTGSQSYAQGGAGALDKLPTLKGCEGKAATFDVTSERMTFESKTRTFIFENKVRVLRCAMTILSDRLQVINDASEKNVERIIATGHVQFQQGNRAATAERADYFEAQQRLVLTGNPRVWDTEARDEVRGEEIVLLLQEEKVLVKQPHVLFHPRKTPVKTP